MSSNIDTAIQAKVEKIKDEMNALIKDRAEVIDGIVDARVAQEHALMIGPGGTGKSLLARNLADHIEDAVYFETAFDETTDPSAVFGPPNIKAMVDDGKVKRNYEGMLPVATDAFLDEFFNGNGPLLHSTMPVLNERVFHNGDDVMPVPLRQVLMGTNKLNADADQAALWDRVHLRFQVDYVKDRDTLANLVGEAIARMVANGRGVSTSVEGQSLTTVTLAELDQAHKEALDLVVPDVVIDTFLDIKQELSEGDAKVIVSDRRVVEGMAAVLSRAWARGHDEVKVADLDILAHMWWTLQDQAREARKVILAATNPGEKAALDLMEVLDSLKKEVNAVKDADETKKKRQGVEAVKNADKVVKEAHQHLAKAKAAGASTAKLEEVIGRTDAFKVEIGELIFGIKPEDAKSLSQA